MPAGKPLQQQMLRQAGRLGAGGAGEIPMLLHSLARAVAEVSVAEDTGTTLSSEQ